MTVAFALRKREGELRASYIDSANRADASHQTEGSYRFLPRGGVPAFSFYDHTTGLNATESPSSMHEVGIRVS